MKASSRRGGSGPLAAQTFAAVLLVAFSLRGAIVAVAPVLQAIRHDNGLSSAGAGLLTSIPVICFGLFSLPAVRLSRRIGLEAALTGSMALLCAGTLLRFAPSLFFLIVGTILIGSGIAVANVLLPALLKREFPGRANSVTALYVATLSIGATIAAGATVPFLKLTGLGWRVGLIAWAPPALLAAVWVGQLAVRRRSENVSPLPFAAVRGLYRDPLAWQVTAYMGMQSFSFYATTSWIPSLYVDRGLSPSHAGLLLALASVSSVPGALLAPMLAGRRPAQHGVMATTSALWLAALTGLALAPTAAAGLWMIVLGVSQGASLGLALTVILLRSPDQEHAAQLSGMAQGLGYLFAGLGPLTVGTLHGLTGAWTIPLLVLCAMMVLQMIVGLGASRDAQIGPAGKDPRSRCTRRQ